MMKEIGASLWFMVETSATHSVRKYMWSKGGMVTQQSNLAALGGAYLRAKHLLTVIPRMEAL